MFGRSTAAEEFAVMSKQITITRQIAHFNAHFASLSAFALQRIAFPLSGYRVMQRTQVVIGGMS
jgi:hypothetical protein